MNLDTSAIPFNDIRNLFKNLTVPNATVIEQVRARNAKLTKPPGFAWKIGRISRMVCIMAGSK